jgi:hypothetical protein
MDKTKFTLEKFSFPVFFLQPTVHQGKKFCHTLFGVDTLTDLLLNIIYSTQYYKMYSCGHGILDVKFMSIQKMSM